MRSAFRTSAIASGDSRAIVDGRDLWQPQGPFDLPRNVRVGLSEVSVGTADDVVAG